MVKKIKFEHILVFLIFAGAFIIRFYQLGYSTLYGDETKVLYLDKSIPASKFFFDQRKGPVQFFVVWVMERLMGFESEFWIRFPFALAGFFSVVVLFLLSKRVFGVKSAIYSTVLYAFSGFSVAFSRTAQYQSFVVLFGLLSNLLFLYALEKKNIKYVVLSSLTFVTAFYSHYDAVFYLIPIIYYLYNFKPEKTMSKVTIISYFVLPSVMLLSIFYLPYILKGFYSANTAGYLNRRLVGGGEYLLNHSLYTFFVYNPHSLFFIPVVLLFFALFKKSSDTIRPYLAMLVIGLVFFELVFLNPGTHIQHYFLPMYLISGFVLAEVETSLIKYKIKAFLVSYRSLIVSMFVFMILFSFMIFVPKFSKGYPWKAKQSFLYSLNVPTNKYHLFLYGFPYDRGWNLIREYLLSKEGVRSVYSNDNDTVAQYYLREFDYTPPGSNFLPQYFIYVFDNQEFGKDDMSFKTNILSYKEDKRFYIDRELTAIIYKLDKSLR